MVVGDDSTIVVVASTIVFAFVVAVSEAVATIDVALAFVVATSYFDLAYFLCFFPLEFW